MTADPLRNFLDALGTPPPELRVHYRAPAGQAVTRGGPFREHTAAPPSLGSVVIAKKRTLTDALGPAALSLLLAVVPGSIVGAWIAEPNIDVHLPTQGAKLLAASTLLPLSLLCFCLIGHLILGVVLSPRHITLRKGSASGRRLNLRFFFAVLVMPWTLHKRALFRSETSLDLLRSGPFLLVSKRQRSSQGGILDTQTHIALAKADTGNPQDFLDSANAFTFHKLPFISRKYMASLFEGYRHLCLDHSWQQALEAAQAVEQRAEDVLAV